MSEFWKNKLAEHQAAGLWRVHQTRLGPQPAQTFNCNDYLGMSNHPQVIQAFKNAADQYGVGSGSANTLSGYTKAHDELRQTLREWLGRDDVLLFSSGYQANLAVLTTLVSKEDHIFADKLNHASLNDGMRFSGARFSRYSLPRHCEDLVIARKVLLTKQSSRIPIFSGLLRREYPPRNDEITIPPRNDGANNWLITESVFSMDGDEADLKKLASFSDQATLIVDEAHSLGLYGPQGSGLIAENKLSQQQVPIMTGMFGKALGTQGAFVAGDQVYIDALMQFARPYLFTTAMAPAIAAATTAAIKLVREADEAREHIRFLIQDFRKKAQHQGLNLANSSSPIQPILFDNIDTVNRLSQRLNQAGISVSSIRYPTVPINSPRLRLSLTANHTPDMISHFFETLQEAMDEEASHTSRL
jgi:8-amino-7-oxononanoate synthase